MSIFWQQKTIESNLVLVIVPFLESYGLYRTPISLQFYSFQLSLFQFRSFFDIFGKFVVFNRLYCPTGDVSAVTGHFAPFTSPPILESFSALQM